MRPVGSEVQFYLLQLKRSKWTFLQACSKVDVLLHGSAAGLPFVTRWRATPFDTKNRLVDESVNGSRKHSSKLIPLSIASFTIDRERR
mmetsp:Transcript_7645/g.19836  ORF Transcript_7645/g.19836 Transcript_7645/m.19836 type:complete len:88 (-) Transcript_7645:562-825(-)